MKNPNKRTPPCPLHRDGTAVVNVTDRPMDQDQGGLVQGQPGAF